jgi:NADH dehydrogenase (ubiquinone) flavoprotein 2
MWGLVPCREKVGKWFIQLCGTTPCMVNGAEEIKATIEKHLGIKEGGEC